MCPFRLSQLSNNESSIDVIEAGRLMLFNPVHPINAYLLKKIEETPDTVDGLCRTVLTEAGNRIARNLADRVTKLLATPTRGLR